VPWEKLKERHSDIATRENLKPPNCQTAMAKFETVKPSNRHGKNVNKQGQMDE